MTLVRFSDVGRQFGARWVVRGVSFAVEAGERWGVVGRNGVGKTTLFRLLTGDDEPTEGEIWRHPGIRFTLLRQNRGEASTATVREAALHPFAELLELERRLELEAAALATADPESPEGERLLHDYDRHLEEFRRRGGYEMRANAEAALEGLGFPPGQWDTGIHRLSGGELGRLRLVQTLLAEPDVLLLDEPTNHLDLRSTEWLEGFLRAYRGTVMVVSHDRVFLQRIADHILHLEGGTAHPYTGGWDAFLIQREERRERERREWEKQQVHITRTEDFIRRNLAGQKTKQAKSRRTLLSRMDRLDRPTEEGRAMALRFGDARRSGATVLRLDGVSCAFGERRLFAPFSAEVGRGERIAIVGPNGCGKSTLMRAIAGVAPPVAGETIPGMGVRAAYYRQDFSHLDPERRVWEEVGAAAPALGMPALRDHLARFLFTRDEIEARIGSLSGGEQARVALASITLQGANLLLLDEPTNHLDIESREVLEEALDEFEGTTLLISHDRALLSAFATRIWAFDGSVGTIRDFNGGYEEWTEQRGRRSEPSAPPSPSPTPSASRQRPSTVPLSKNELQRRQRELARMEERIAVLEREIEEGEARLADPALYAADADPTEAVALGRRRDRANAELAELYAAWEAAGEQLAQV